MKEHGIFIAHTNEDREWARAFAKSLQSQGAKVWVHDWGVRRVTEAIEKGLRESDVIAFVMSPKETELANFYFELGAALADQKHIVPIVDKQVKSADLPGPLRVRVNLKRTSPGETAERLAAQIRDLKLDKAALSNE